MCIHLIARASKYLKLKTDGTERIIDDPQLEFEISRPLL